MKYTATAFCCRTVFSYACTVYDFGRLVTFGRIVASTEFVSGIIIVCSSAVLEGHISNIASVAESVNEIVPRAEKIHNYLCDAGLYSKESMTSVLAVESAGNSVKIRELHRL